MGFGIFQIHAPLPACWLVSSFCGQHVVHPRIPQSVSHIKPNVTTRYLQTQPWCHQTQNTPQHSASSKPVCLGRLKQAWREGACTSLPRIHFRTMLSSHPPWVCQKKISWRKKSLSKRSKRGRENNNFHYIFILPEQGILRVINTENYMNRCNNPTPTQNC